MEFNATEHQHIRYNPLRGDWVLISPHRLQRPWSGKVDSLQEELLENDPKNPLSPGATRPNGAVNPHYESTYVFNNDFPALLQEVPEPDVDSGDPLFKIAGAKGSCRVLCFHPKSNITIPLMTVQEIKRIIDKWCEELQELGKHFTWVQIFENKGDQMGCSNPHPHCQIWSSSFLPNEPKLKDSNQKAYWQKYKSVMLLDYINRELERKERLVEFNDSWVCLVPYWAIWPFETMLLPRRHILRLTDLTEDERISLADIMKKLTIRYDNLFCTSFPYSMGWHGAPTGSLTSEDNSHWQLHAIYYPPLLRSATIRKFMVGYEMLAQPQRDLTAEQAADRLRSVSLTHYKFQS
ncbi:galactose-1-phosphate uridylyltransferase-like isoform X2 [Artemia franciscana]|uniref:Galactose-1-phosphate uridylyltransferase n=1 Tax=Artemia franciscana TaxID=6661 RepID=A0AA88HCW1_ARTSF|nr:hypothetical protein QYM36_018438 [Artemia franciscana]